jgi:hypothetical protein
MGRFLPAFTDTGGVILLYKSMEKLLPVASFCIHLSVPVHGQLYYQYGRICDLDTGIYQCIPGIECAKPPGKKQEVIREV